MTGPAKDWLRLRLLIDDRVMMDEVVPTNQLALAVERYSETARSYDGEGELHLEVLDSDNRLITAMCFDADSPWVGHPAQQCPVACFCDSPEDCSWVAQAARAN